MPSSNASSDRTRVKSLSTTVRKLRTLLEMRFSSVRTCSFRPLVSGIPSRTRPSGFCTRTMPRCSTRSSALTSISQMDGRSAIRWTSNWTRRRLRSRAAACTKRELVFPIRATANSMTNSNNATAAAARTLMTRISVLAGNRRVICTVIDDKAIAVCTKEKRKSILLVRSSQTISISLLRAIMTHSYLTTRAPREENCVV
mmetsp:Transcript_12102/g.24649  ORF Transcript_12102/g.24649 Transcript_12102/m.24649 type:complete len:200 (+) Transcript_12102:2501-3100(+)